jgi:hypothetical protein
MTKLGEFVFVIVGVEECVINEAIFVEICMMVTLLIIYDYLILSTENVW